MRIFSYLISICVCVSVYCLDSVESPAVISIEHPDDLRIIDQTNNSEQGRFQIVVFSNPQKCIDGSLKFLLKINFKNFNETVRFDDKIIEDTVNGKVFCVVVPKSELKNEIFFRDIQLRAEKAYLKFDKIKLKIEPKVSISANTKEVNFGRILHNGAHMASENSPSVIIGYSILKDAVCEVTSKNNFRLKNKNSYIPYSMSGLTKNGEINLPSDRDQYVANFKISICKKKPIAGIYRDKITFSIKTQL